MDSSTRRHVFAKQPPSNKVYEVTDGLLGVNEHFLKIVKSNIQKTLVSEELELPRISSLAARIMQVANAPNADVEKIVEVVRTDPYLAGRILSLINSAYFATRQEVTSLRHAIVLLGLKAVGDLIFCASLRIKVFKCPAYESLMSSVWTHSVGVAVATEALSQTRGRGREPGFMAGLLHDIGKPPVLAAIVETETKLHPGRHIGEESALLLIDQLHVQVGGLLARKWMLAPEIEEGISGHDTFRNGMGPLALFVYCGNKIAHHLCLGSKHEEVVPSTDAGFSAVGLTDPEEFARVLDTVHRHTERLTGIL